MEKKRSTEYKLAFNKYIKDSFSAGVNNDQLIQD